MTIPRLGLALIVLSLIWVGLVFRHTSFQEGPSAGAVRQPLATSPSAAIQPLSTNTSSPSAGSASLGSPSAVPSRGSPGAIAVRSGPPLPPDPNAHLPVVTSRDEPVPGAAHLVRRTRIIRTTFKYPLWRVEELLARDPKTGTEIAVGRSTMVANHVILRLQAGVMIDRVEALAAPIGARVIRTLHSPGLCLVGVPNADPDTVPRLLAALNREGTVVRYAEPDYIVHVTQTQPNDSRFSELWGMNNTGQPGGTADADIDAPEAWDIATGNSEVVVAVVDTGIDINHPDLVSNIWSNPLETVNGVDDDGNGFIDDVRGWDFVNHDNAPLDDYGHGTHVAGTIAATGNNSAGVVGVNWQARIMALKFIDSSGSGSTSDAIEALRYATSLRRSGINVRITNNSWGGGGDSASLSEVIRDQGEAGILFVAAAGNYNYDNDASPFYPASYPWSNIISVAATDQNDAKASFSQYGLTSVDLGAPGDNILSTIPGGGYGYMDGTSMATPHVAGVAALLWSTQPEASVQAVSDAILNGTDPIDSMAGITVTGGRLNAYQALIHFFNIHHTPRTNTYNTGDPYAIDAIVGPERLVDTNALYLFWNTDGSTNFASLPMISVSNTLYRGSIPVQVEGTTIYYWLEATPTIGPAICHPAQSPTVLHAFQIVPPLGLTVASSTNIPATLSPASGYHTYPSGLVVQASAALYDQMDGSRWICTGWTGTGSVPESGASNAVAFALSMESTLEWLWREDHYPIVHLTPEAIETVLRPNSESNVSVSVSNTGKTNLILNVSLLSLGFADDGEKGVGGWTHSGTRDRWTLTTNRFVSSSNAWYCGDPLTRLYTTNMHARLDTPPILLGSGAQLTFRHWIKCEIDHTSEPGYAWDGGIVEISTNAGLTFTQIAPVGGYSHKMSEWSASPWEQDTPCFAGTGGWQQVTFDLSALSQKAAIIRFHFGSDENAQEEGWYLDDVVVTPDSQSNLWLSVTPAQLDVPSGGSTNLTVTLNTTGIATGERQSAIRLDGNAPFRVVPVNLAVRSPAVLSGLQAAQTSTQGEGLVTISNLIHDADGDTCALDVAWSASGGASWSNLTILAAQDLLGLITLNPSNGPPVENIQTAVSALNFTNSLTLTWNTSASGSDILLNPGMIIRGRAWDGLYWSDWTTSQPFMVDNEPPGSPGEITSATHTPSSWSTNSLLTIQWPAASDGAGVGIASYDYGVGAHAPACTTTGRTVGLSVNSLPLADGSNGFVIVRARDQFGNTGAVAVGGPYWVDTAPPSATNATVTLVHSPFGNYLVGATSMTGTWSGFSDSASGIRDYYYASSNQAGSTNGILTALTSGVLSNTQTGVTNRFFVWATDHAGLIGPAVESFCLILDAAGDEDEDLISNGNEELTGTDAGNPASVLRLTPSQPETAEEFTLQWPALTNRLYTLYYRDTLLTDTNWMAVPGFIDVPGFSGTMIHTGLTGVLPARFYKITVRAP